MKLKRVSFEVANALKESGYPQELNEGTVFYAENGLMDVYDSELYELFDPMNCTAPTYFEVWLWLWREKKIHLFTKGKDILEVEIVHACGTKMWGHEINIRNSDPEEAIIAAIDYLVDNDLIK